MAIENKKIDWIKTDVGELRSNEFLLLAQMIGDANMFQFLKLRDAIYEQGFYILWTPPNNQVYCILNNLKVDDMTAIIKSACVCGLLSQELFEWYGVVTSTKIQLNYFKVANRRIKESVFYEYLAIPKSQMADTLKKINVINLKEEPVNLAKPSAKAKPKEKIFHIEIPDLFSPASEVMEKTIQKKREIDIAIKEFTEPKKLNGNHLETYTEVIDITGDKNQIPAKSATPWEDIVKFSLIKYEDLPEEKRDKISKPAWLSYRSVILFINDNYPILHKNQNPIRWDRWSVFYEEQGKLGKHKWFNQNEIEGGIHKMGSNGIPESSDMLYKLIDNCHWFRDPNWKRESTNK